MALYLMCFNCIANIMQLFMCISYPGFSSPCFLC